jgi:hypothetical protein
MPRIMIKGGVWRNTEVRLSLPNTYMPVQGIFVMFKSTVLYYRMKF